MAKIVPRGGQLGADEFCQGDIVSSDDGDILRDFLTRLLASL